MANKHKRSTLDSFLQEEGMLEEVKAAAVKRVNAMRSRQEVEKALKSLKERLSYCLKKLSVADKRGDEKSAQFYSAMIRNGLQKIRVLEWVLGNFQAH